MSNIITVDFRNDTLFAVERDDGVFVALKPICDALGLRWDSQYRRALRDPILSEGIAMMAMPSPSGAQETTCLRLDLVNGWLFTIDESRVRDDETRQKVLTYKRECYSVLFRHFYGKAAAPDIGADEEAETSEGTRLRMVTEARHTFGVRSGAELWFKLGLPIVPSMLQEPRQYDLLHVADKNNQDAAA